MSQLADDHTLSVMQATVAACEYSNNNNNNEGMKDNRYNNNNKLIIKITRHVHADNICNYPSCCGQINDQLPIFERNVQ